MFSCLSCHSHSASLVPGDMVIIFLSRNSCPVLCALLLICVAFSVVISTFVGEQKLHTMNMIRMSTERRLAHVRGRRTPPPLRKTWGWSVLRLVFRIRAHKVYHAPLAATHTCMHALCFCCSKSYVTPPSRSFCLKLFQMYASAVTSTDRVVDSCLLTLATRE